MTNTATTIRKATAADLPYILEIVNDAILNSTAIYDYEPRSMPEQQQWFSEKETSGFPVIVAVADGTVIGFGTYDTFRIKAAYRFTVEHSLYVSQNARAKGTGKLLLEKLIALAKSEGYHLMIGCIDADNSGSIRFHEKFGFESSGTIREAGHKFGRWLDLVMVQLILEP